MPQLLLELFSEEIPARMQAKAAEDLRAAVTNGLVDAGLTYEGAQAHATPRRLVLAIEGLTTQSKDSREERKGPKVDAPQAAIDGFLKSTGLTLDQLAKQDDKKGQFYIAVIKKSGRLATDVIAELVPDIIRKFPWPKSMRWGSGTLRWVRPLHSILCTFDGEVVPFEVDDIKSSNTTRGHRFLSPDVFTARRFDDYADKLHKAHVIVDATARAETIKTEARNLTFAQGLELVEDETLFREVAGLVEWPVVLMGEFDQSYLDVPPEVIITTIKNNQKCFCVRDGKTGKLANKYVLIANTVPKDGGKEIIRGNNKVIAARLSDAKFFWDLDRKVSLESLLPKLDAITFHAKLGTQGERVKRIETLAAEIAKTIGADVEKTKQAARLAKADLVTNMVGEFPELQGAVGRYIALDQNIDSEVADAIRDHWKPQGPSDSLPVSKIGQAVALADKLDTLVGFWEIDQKPTGSKDPYALRRSALGVVRIVVEGEINLPIGWIVRQPRFERQLADMTETEKDKFRAVVENEGARDEGLKPKHSAVLENAGRSYIEGQQKWDQIHQDLNQFIVDRLKVMLRENGLRHDYVEAAASADYGEGLLFIARLAETLSSFFGTAIGVSLLAGVKRAYNILKIEEKREGRVFGGPVDPVLLTLPEEIQLNLAIEDANPSLSAAIKKEDFESALRSIAQLRAPVDAFFEAVKVNDDNPAVRANRLALLNRIRAATAQVADFSKIEG